MVSIIDIHASPTNTGLMPNGSNGVVGHDARGRGAQTNHSGRYESHQFSRIDDGWCGLEDLPPLKTHVSEENPRKIITTNSSPDIGFDQSINPYRGCEHGCTYCFARPTHAYMGLSPGLDFESKLFAKTNAAERLQRELAAPGYKPKTIAIGTNTDPYQPIERERRITRSILQVLAKFRHPVAIVTKSALVTRDIDILAPMAAQGLVKVAVSLTTLDHRLSRSMEPRASTPQKRLLAISSLARAGIPTVAMIAPIIPALNDAEIEALLKAASQAGAKEAAYILLRLPLEVRNIFRDWLKNAYPDKADHVFSLIRSMHNGKDYDATWGKRMRGTGPHAWSIGRRFELACERLGLNKEPFTLTVDLFQRPSKPDPQLSLFAFEDLSSVQRVESEF